MNEMWTYIIGQEKATNTCYCTYTFVQKSTRHFCVLYLCVCSCMAVMSFWPLDSQTRVLLSWRCRFHDVCGEFRELDHWLFVNCLTPFWCLEKEGSWDYQHCVVSQQQHNLGYFNKSELDRTYIMDPKFNSDFKTMCFIKKSQLFNHLSSCLLHFPPCWKGFLDAFLRAHDALNA